MQYLSQQACISVPSKRMFLQPTSAELLEERRNALKLLSQLSENLSQRTLQ